MINRSVMEKESARWVEKEIITEEQKERILSLYPPQKTKPEKSSRINIASVMVGLAAVLFSMGVILFYAANWKRMPVSAKVIQVYLLIFALYGLSFYHLAIRKKNIKLGRVLLMMAMISFGAGIMLIAQIFHISAHPTNGLLIWATGTLAMSAVMKEKWGYHLSFILFIIWNNWEYSGFDNPNYVFIVPLIIIGWLYYKGKQNIAVIFSFIFTISWFYQINTYWIESVVKVPDEYGAFTFAISHLPLGIILAGTAWLVRKNETLKYTSRIMAVAGYIFMATPFAVLSWPGKYTHLNLTFIKGLEILYSEAIILTIIAGIIIWLLYRRSESVIFFMETVLFTVLFLALPLGHTTTRMVYSHIAILIYISTFLYLTHERMASHYLEKVMAFMTFIFFMTLKFFGFMGIGILDHDYRVAYFLGFVIFLTVCFLINQLLSAILVRKDIPYKRGILNSVSAVLLFFNIYSLSFEMGKQKSIFTAEPIVLIMLFLFIAISVILYLSLWKFIKESTMLILSAFVFAVSLAVLFVTGPERGWIFYSVVFNLLLFAVTGTFIFYSVKIHSRMLLNLAIAGFILHTGTRYFDLFWDMLSGSLLFIITALVLFAGAWIIEKNRRRLIDRMNRNASGESI